MSLESTRVYRKHKNCPVQVVVGPFGPHYAKLICTRHNKQIQWLNQQDAIALLEHT